MQQVVNIPPRTAPDPRTETPKALGGSEVQHTPAGVPALEVVDLTRDFRSGFRRKRQRGIEGISFSVPPGIVFALLGHNGAGKTTTINCILDLVHSGGGRVRIFGREHTEPSARAAVGYLPERPYFFEHLSGRELLRFSAGLLHMDRARQAKEIPEILATVGLEEAADQRLRKYSKGMLQRIGLGQALLGDPDLLILDEPMSGLDPVGRRQVRELLQGLRDRGKTIIFSSHIVPDIEMLADEVAILNRGRLVAHHPLADLNRSTLYEVQAVIPSNREPQVLEGYTLTRHGGAVHIQADGVEELNGLLTLGAERRWKILGVGTRRSGLEELFMQTRDQGEAKS
ncbi:hypothetical protein CO151_05450 [bacterium CG_4_9_14_3_um_filter_65_15]|nr:MAG: hypothetical protein CO151_05450 [bacterium CG_4_9_14_3_um_filter_65_15]